MTIQGIFKNLHIKPEIKFGLMVNESKIFGFIFLKIKKILKNKIKK
jgi:hypothetical protein